ncbi:hypothetical protein M422DRAFT_52487 [Sphaerobolus stellatus SS14]|uniref:DNA 3'-5' helicase n=1 Tax=Sphaerobolus stellatus (strain SS14) TaxID=990650 RepID=A0A0C9TSJ2_SPHS4|nr:hypothetical protein M422DRAFT_52487 [Sphaerobolus stellatus SS14]
MSRRFWRVWDGLEGKTATLPIQFRPDLMHDVSSAIADVMETHGTLSEAAIITLVSEIMAQQLGQWTGEFKNNLRIMIIVILLDLGLGDGRRSQQTNDIRPSHSRPSCSHFANQDISMETSSGVHPPEQPSSTTTEQPLSNFLRPLEPYSSVVCPNIPSPAQPSSIIPLPVSSVLSAKASPPFKPPSDGILFDLLKKQYPCIQYPTFKSPAQHMMAKMSVERKKNFVVIMPTGSGKSLSWMLPAWIQDDKMTAIIVPHSSLLNNHIHAAEEAKIPCIRWTVETLRVPPGTKFIFLALESATSPKWEEFLKQNETCIVRSVIDEAHEILTMESFRQNFDRIHMLASHRHQRIFLTATLPPLRTSFPRESEAPSHYYNYSCQF